jgi:hypothetical protein
MQDDVRQRLRTQLSAAVHAAFATFTRHASLVTQTNPRGSAAHVLDRADVRAALAQGTEEARLAVSALVRQAWEAGGGPPGDITLSKLLSDVIAAYSTAEHEVLSAARDAFESVPVREFMVGVTEPGSQPLMESARDRASAVEEAIRNAVDRLLVSNRASVDVAATGSAVAAVLEEGFRRQAAGEHVMKRWRSKKSPRTCHWCWELDGTTIPLEDEFPHGVVHEFPHARLRHVRTPAGARHFHRPIGAPIIFTFPPSVWGKLLGPPRHPQCECWLELVILGAGEGPVPAAPPQPEHEHPFLRASDIASLPPDQYHAMLAFISAAAHELRLLLRRLLGL